jgi:hypothetical protein
MRNAMRFALLIVAFAAGASAWPAGQVQQAGGGRGAGPGALGEGLQQAPVGTGFLAGQVVDVPGGKPISDVTVQVLGRYVVNGRSSLVVNPAVVTDSQGRFFFGNLRAGSYSLQVGKTGYVGPRAGGPVVIELADGERVTDAVARLMKVASLAGTLRDESGDPVVGADVLVMRRTVTSGRQVWQPLKASRSDDRGQYRAGTLPPGDYVVCACPRNVSIPFDSTLLTTLGSEPLQLMTVAARALSIGSDVASLDNTLRTYAPTLHPNATTVTRATKVTLAPGEDKIAVDINLPLVRSTRVSGTITGASSPVQAGFIALVPAPDGDGFADQFSLTPMLVQADGRFDFAMVPPGQYRLIVMHRETGARSGGPSGMAMAFVGPRGTTPPPVAATMSGPAPAQDIQMLWANEPVTVGENGVRGLVISLNRALNVAGRVQWIGAAPPPTAQMLQRAPLLMTPSNFLDPLTTQIRTAVGRMSPDATFVVTDAVPGKWIITPTVMPGYPTLKSVTIGGLDITDMALEVAEKDIADVVITYVDKPMASLTVVSGPASPGPPAADDPSILVFPADRKFWIEPVAAGRRFRNWVLTTQGTTTTSDLPAGDYFVVRVPGLEAVDSIEATKLDALARRAQRVTVPDTGSARIEVRR